MTGNAEDGRADRGASAPATGIVAAICAAAHTAFASVLDRMRHCMPSPRNAALSEAAKGADLARAAFLGSIGHELRTPLNAILGFSEILKDELFGDLGQPQYRGYAMLIHNSAEHLLDVINELLDIAKAEGGKLELEEEVVDVARAVAICVDLVAARAASKTISVSIPPDLQQLRADPRRVKQILLNLLANAVKFTPAGGRIEVAAARDAEGRLAITVSDTGIGMAEADISRATELFARDTAERSRKFPGAGIGLPLSKALIERHGGDLIVASRLGAGTCVTVRFPKERVVGAAKPGSS